jgi:exodeoxyribonuclease VII large subunit
MNTEPTPLPEPGEPATEGPQPPRPAAIPGSRLAGPFPVGEYAAALRRQLRGFARVQLVGELVNLRVARARVYFELRDAGGALPCAAWRDHWDAVLAQTGPLGDGMQVVVAGGCDYYPGSATSSPGFSFGVTDLRVAGEGDLLARIDRLRKALYAEGLLEPQKQLPRALLPRTIGVVTGEGGKARDDVLAGLRRRGWAGRLVWAFAPVQDRHAAPAITRALQDLAVVGGVEVVIVARGGGSLIDLLCFCDETLCRTVALLPVPVIASVGHHTDRTVLDDVAAVCCSTPTHAAEAAVPLHCGEARRQLRREVECLHRHADLAVLGRARVLARQARAPTEHVTRQRARLDQSLRELRASSRRRVTEERALAARRLLVLTRKLDVAGGEQQRRRAALAAATGDLQRAGALVKRRRELEHLSLALAAHDPERTLERGYALVHDSAGGLVTSAEAARKAERVRVSFADSAVDATIEEGHEHT